MMNFSKLANISIRTAFVFVLSGVAMPSAFADNAKSNDGASPPVAIASLTTGLVVGTPLAMTRLSARGIGEVYHAYDDDNLSWKFWGRPLCVPFGILKGTTHGLIVGPKNALKNCGSSPFSKDSFSLGELE